MKKKRRRRRQRRPTEVTRFAAGRASDASDWVGGAGWQEETDGHLVIELVLSLHHDQARCLYRAYNAATRLENANTIDFPGGAQLIAMPVQRGEGDVVYARLNRWRTDQASRWHRLVGRIGLGLERAMEVATIPLQFQAISTTARDGRPFHPIEAEAFAVLDGDRVVGKLDAGEPQLDITRLTDEPVYVTGVGLGTELPGVPAIFHVLALGTTPQEAGMRGEAIFLATGMGENPNIALKTARITSLDAMLIRRGMEEGLKTAAGQPRRILEVALGRVDELAEPDQWQGHDPGHDPAACAAMEREPASQLTVNHDGLPQIWDSAATPDPYWGQKVQ